jgi:hypothetical protein
MNPTFRRILAAASIAFGAFILVTSVVGIALGIQSFNGWLAVIYGSLGASMGNAGIIGVWVKQPLRGALLGWFLVGIGSRAIMEGTVYLFFISVPIAAVLLAALIYEMQRRPSVAGTLSALGGGALAILSLVVLAYVAPHLPALCPYMPAEGTSRASFSYPGGSFPWEGVQSQYFEQCAGAPGA